MPRAFPQDVPERRARWFAPTVITDAKSTHGSARCTLKADQRKRIDATVT
jgi:hypothetical protein